MSEKYFYILLYIWIAIALIALPFLLKITQPYGRHSSKNWGPMIDNKLGWIIQEGVAPFFISFWFFTGHLSKTNTSYFLLFLYIAHYIYRSYIYPFRTKTNGKQIPLIICLSAIFFNFCNTFFLGYYLGNIGGNYSNSFFYSPIFFIGIIIFVAGVFINVKSDNILLSLRKPTETDYKIPTGFLFKYVSCPNHFGEIIEWLGYSIILFSPVGISFFVWTFVNLVPRTLDHHKWYHQNFPDYPKDRKAIFPFLL